MHDLLFSPALPDCLYIGGGITWEACPAHPFRWRRCGHPRFIPQLLLSLAACVLIFLLLRSIRNRNLYQPPFLREMGQDHELQVFAGAFTAGLYIGRTNAFHWLDTSLKPFKVFFIALFFVALGLMVDIPFILTNALAHKAGIIDADVFKGVVAVIVLTLLLSTPWALAFRKSTDKPTHPLIPKKTTLWP
jgi:hypothetical protein